MVDLILAIILVTLVGLAIRRTRYVQLDNPIIIQRPGQYHIILASQLSPAQAFIEQIARKFILLHPPPGDLPSQYYEIREPMVVDYGESAYLLAITLRAGILYLQAINPRPLIYDADSHYKTLRAFSEAMLKQYPLSKSADEQWAEKLRASVDAIAGELNITAQALQATD